MRNLLATELKPGDTIRDEERAEGVSRVIRVDAMRYDDAPNEVAHVSITWDDDVRIAYQPDYQFWVRD